jgi:hypothetical protein
VVEKDRPGSCSLALRRSRNPTMAPPFVCVEIVSGPGQPGYRGVEMVVAISP